jgi:predicted amidophosphoribosyltransferase
MISQDRLSYVEQKFTTPVGDNRYGIPGYYCSKCEEELDYVYNYCPTCGRRIDWRTVEKEKKKCFLKM